MNFLDLLAEAAEKPWITESFLKWVVSGMGGTIVVMAKYLWTMVQDRHEYMQKLVEGLPAARAEIEEEVRARFTKVIEKFESENASLKEEIKGLNTERWQMLQAQIDDAKQQEKGLRELSSDYNEALDRSMEITESVINELRLARTCRKES